MKYPVARPAVRVSNTKFNNYGLEEFAVASSKRVKCKTTCSEKPNGENKAS